MEMVGSTDGLENATIGGSLHRPNLSATDSDEIKSEVAFYKNAHGNWLMMIIMFSVFSGVPVRFNSI
jgi:hypothetical protein